MQRIHNTQQQAFTQLEQLKNPTVAALLSFIITGAGQIYNGEVGKGIGLIFAYFLCWSTASLFFPLVILIGMWVWGMVDAYEKAQMFNQTLRDRIEEEKTSIEADEEKKKAEQCRTVYSQDFVEQLDKLFLLFKSGILTDDEFHNRKQAVIDQLQIKKIKDNTEDFLASLIPLSKKSALSPDDITKIKTFIL